MKKLIIDLKKDSENRLQLAQGGTLTPDEIPKALKDDSLHHCKPGFIRPWNEFDCFKPRFIGRDEDDNYDFDNETANTGYLACWTPEGCPFKAQCYRQSASYYA